ncbi:PDZ domain-containing protein [Rhizobium sp. F40D2]|uniref:PDZ domain-containing protein n=1 Tax=Rhizobium sp. F40D2 TaxID=3453141 RepID=UPI003F254778
MTAQDLTRSLAIAFNVDAGPGALVNEVRPGSPAEAAGIRPDDTIRSLNGTIVRSASDLHKVVGTWLEGARLDRSGRRARQRHFDPDCSSIPGRADRTADRPYRAGAFCRCRDRRQSRPTRREGRGGH